MTGNAKLPDRIGNEDDDGFGGTARTGDSVALAAGRLPQQVVVGHTSADDASITALLVQLRQHLSAAVREAAQRVVEKIRAAVHSLPGSCLYMGGRRGVRTIYAAWAATSTVAAVFDVWLRIGDRGYVAAQQLLPRLTRQPSALQG